MGLYFVYRLNCFITKSHNILPIRKPPTNNIEIVMMIPIVKNKWREKKASKKKTNVSRSTILSSPILLSGTSNI